MTEPKDAIEQKREEILRSELGWLLDWHVPEITKTVGPYDPHAFDAFDSDRRDLISQCEAKLKTYTEDRLDALLRRDGDDPEDTVTNWRHFLRDDLDNLRNSRPAWYAGGFGHPDYTADFEYWCKMSGLSLHELLCLSVGVEPELINQEKLASLSSDQSRPASRPRPIRKITKFLLRRKEQIERSFFTGDFQTRIPPRQFLEWSRLFEFELPAEFEEQLQRYHLEPSNDESKPAPGKKPHKREIDVIAQLFTAMAMEYYGYKPRSARSPIPKEIADMVASLGLSVTPETVRKYLRIGAEKIPDDWEPNKP